MNFPQTKIAFVVSESNWFSFWLSFRCTMRGIRISSTHMKPHMYRGIPTTKHSGKFVGLIYHRQENSLYLLCMFKRFPVSTHVLTLRHSALHNMIRTFWCSFSFAFTFCGDVSYVYLLLLHKVSGEFRCTYAVLWKSFVRLKEN